MILCLVSVFSNIANLKQGEETTHMRPISISCSALMMISYVAFLIFQLFTHRALLADGGDDDDEEEGPSISLRCSLTLLTVVTIIVGVCSELLTGTLDTMLESTGLTRDFVG